MGTGSFPLILDTPLYHASHQQTSQLSSWWCSRQHMYPHFQKVAQGTLFKSHKRRHLFTTSTCRWHGMESLCVVKDLSLGLGGQGREHCTSFARSTGLEIISLFLAEFLFFCLSGGNPQRGNVDMVRVGLGVCRHLSSVVAISELFCHAGKTLLRIRLQNVLLFGLELLSSFLPPPKTQPQHPPPQSSLYALCGGGGMLLFPLLFNVYLYE